MKLFYTFLFIGLLSASSNAQEFEFDKETIDYGKITKSSNGERTFTFTNIGDAPIVITKIQSSCGCTVPKKPEKPILPNEKGEIKVSYDTRRLGGFSKQVTIMSKAKTPIKVIKIRGLVIKGISLEKKKSILSNH